ncbi:MAG: stage 0 sporulation protein [Ruminococcaceae bacterium]|nr:stage 0 sporulation protein [Oscillospiraceae bacterium]
MTEVISVKFKDGGKAYYFDPAGQIVKKGDVVIVEMQSGREMGFISEGNHSVNDEDIVPPLRKMLRKATEKDFKKVEENKQKQEEALKVCEEMVIRHKLDMKLVSAEYSFDCSRIVFFFTSDGRVDFRELVKDLAAHFHTRIELRQIGVRDEAKMLGGLGICGQPYCCKRFLNDFQTVSIKMAKEQGLSLNPTKVSGSCGRLMCCLKYEQDAYEYLNAHTPRVGSTVKTPDGLATVTDVNLITGNLFVKLLDSESIPFKIHRDKVKLVSKFKKSNENINYDEKND